MSDAQDAKYSVLLVLIILIVQFQKKIHTPPAEGIRISLGGWGVLLDQKN